MVLTYMQRRPSGIYEFRQHLPKAIAGKPAPAFAREPLAELINPKTGNFKRELTKSLDTKDYRTARRNDLREATRVEALFADALTFLAGGEQRVFRANMPSLEEIEAHALREVLLEDEQERRDGDPRRQLQTPAEREAIGPNLEPIRFDARGMTASSLEVMEQEIDIWLGDWRDA